MTPTFSHLFSEAELANGNTAGSFGYQKLDKHNLSYLSSALRQKFDSLSFEIQWENEKAEAKGEPQKNKQISRTILIIVRLFNNLF